jgi:hypothetical protein
MTKNVTTIKNDETGLWNVKDANGERLCSNCHTFHSIGIGYRSRKLARQAIREYTSATLVGGLH